MLKKLTNWVKELFFYPPELKEMQRRALEANRIYQQALEKAAWPKDFKAEDVKEALDKQAPKPAVKRKPALKKASTRSPKMAVAKKSVAKKVTKEMEYDYKTGKKSFPGSTAKKDAHAEKEGKRVAKALAYDINKAKKK